MIDSSRKLSAVLPIALLMAPGICLARAKPLEVRWNELGPMVTGHSVTLTLTDGMQVKGQAVAAREDALLRNVSSPVPGYEKGNGSVPRGSVIAIDVKRERGIGGRALEPWSAPSVGWGLASGLTRGTTG